MAITTYSSQNMTLFMSMMRLKRLIKDLKQCFNDLIQCVFALNQVVKIHGPVR
jgi:hypothetical protein